MADGGSTSSSNSGRANDQPEILLPSTIWIDIDRESGAEGSTPRIPKVPSTMRKNENLTKVVPKWSEPSMISIGPYHFKVEYYEEQKLKTKHADMFIKESKQKRDDLYRRIDERTPELKKWYEGSTDRRDEDLKAIFLVDGCFLLNFINYSNEEDGFTKLGLTNSEMVNIKRDLFLLENQLPYAVLQLLLPRTDHNYKNGMEEKIRRFVASYAPTSPLKISGQQEENRNSPIQSQVPESSNVQQEHRCERVMQAQAEQLEQQGENRNSPIQSQVSESSNAQQEHRGEGGMQTRAERLEHQGENRNLSIHLQAPESSNAGQQHLLHRLQGILLRSPQAEQLEQRGENRNSPCHQLLNRLQGILLRPPQAEQLEQRGENRNSPCHQLLNRLQGILFHRPESSNSPQEHEPGQQGQQRGRTTHWRSCRTVQELRKVGVRFKPSATGSFTDISFKPADFGTAGCLQLPTITLNTLTMTTFLNLIAFESSNSSSANKFGVISYLCFMDSLIDSEDDVKELQAAGILHNSIGGTKEVAYFFNTVCSNVMPHPSYRDVIQKIENHVNREAYKSRWRRSCVELKQKKFSSPWTFIALIAGITGLALTATQVYYAVHPQQP